HLVRSPRGPHPHVASKCCPRQRVLICQITTDLPRPERAVCGKLPKIPHRKPSTAPFSMHPASVGGTKSARLRRGIGVDSTHRQTAGDAEAIGAVLGTAIPAAQPSRATQKVLNRGTQEG